MLGLILTCTATFAVSNIIVSTIMSLAVSFYQSLKSAMLSTILIGLSAIFVFQQLAKTPSTAMLIVPLGLISMYVAVKYVTNVAASAAVIMGISNMAALYIVYKMSGYALTTSFAPH